MRLSEFLSRDWAVGYATGMILCAVLHFGLTKAVAGALFAFAASLTFWLIDRYRETRIEIRNDAGMRGIVTVRGRLSPERAEEIKRRFEERWS